MARWRSCAARILEADVGGRVYLQWMKNDIRPPPCMAGNLQLKSAGSTLHRACTDRRS